MMRDRLVVVGVAPRAEHHGAEAQRADLHAGAAEGAVARHGVAFHQVNDSISIEYTGPSGGVRRYCSYLSRSRSMPVAVVGVGRVVHDGGAGRPHPPEHGPVPVVVVVHEQRRAAGAADVREARQRGRRLRLVVDCRVQAALVAGEADGDQPGARRSRRRCRAGPPAPRPAGRPPTRALASVVSVRVRAGPRPRHRPCNHGRLLCAKRSRPEVRPGSSRPAAQGGYPPSPRRGDALVRPRPLWPDRTVGIGNITVFLADDNLLVREGVRALLEHRARSRGRRCRRRLRRAGRRAPTTPSPRSSSPTSACRRTSRTRASRPPRRSASGIPGTGVVILSQYDDPEYAISLLERGCGRLRLPAEGPGQRRQQPGPRDPRGRHRRLDARPRDRAGARRAGPRRRRASTAEQEELLRQVAEGRPVKAIAATQQHDARGGQRRDRGALPGARPGRERRPRGRAAPAPAAAEGDRRARGAGRDAQPAAARRGRRAAARRPRTRSAAPSGWS